MTALGQSAQPIGQRISFAKADAIALGVVAVGFALRLGSIGEYWNNADEGIYFQIAHAPAAIANAMVASNAHPPLYYYLLRAVASVFDDFLWLRVPALVFGTLSIWALYRLGSSIGGAVLGLSAAAMLAVSPGAIELSQVARPYAFHGWLLIGATGSLLRYWQTRRPRSLVSYTAWMLVAISTHYSSALVLGGFGVALGIAMLARDFSARELRDLAIAHTPVLLACLALYFYHVEPVLLDSAMRKEALGSWLGEFFATGPAALWQNFVGIFDYLAGAAFAGVGSIVFLLSIAACLRAKRFALVGVCVSVVVVTAVASTVSIYPFGATRHAAFLLPFLVLVVAMAAEVAVSLGMRVAMGVALLLAFIVLARGPISQAMGVVPRAPIEQPEFEITRAEVDALRDPFNGITRTPGVIFMDLSTAYTLLPLVRETAIESEWVLVSNSRQFIWGERQVVVIPQWYMAVSDDRINASNHLWSSIRRVRERPDLARQLEIDAQLVSSNGMALPRAIRALSLNRAERTAVVADVSRTKHLSAFRLDVAEYQRQLARAVRERGNEQQESDGARIEKGPAGSERVSIAKGPQSPLFSAAGLRDK